jgi:uncharacterized membrane protein YjgN (DUF898 family)
MSESPDISSEPPRASDPALAFTATRGGFAKILLINTLLTVLTLGIYRFWGRTRLRRYLWRHTRLLGDPLEYTGTGGELFLGFLIVIAVLFPLGAIYGAIDTLIGPHQTGLRITAEVTYYAVLFALIQIGFYRMWRYRMSRTVWRGIRFGLDGSTWTYLKLAIGWTFLTVITFGIAYPWMSMDLIKPWLFVNVPLAVYVALLTLAGYVANEASNGVTGGLAREIEWFVRQNVTLSIVMGVVPVVSILALPITYFYYMIRQSRLMISGLEVGQASFASGLPFGRLLGFAALGGLLTVVLALPIVASIGFGISESTAPAAMPIIGFIAFFVFAAVLFPFIWAVIFSFEFLKQVITTMTITNAEVIETFAQGAEADIKTGEGLADALDIGGF